MSWLSTLGGWFVPQPEHFRQSEFPAFEDQLKVLRTRYASARPWRTASVNEALGFPAIFGAVSLISNTVGSLSQEAFRQGVRLDPADAPRIISRPNPFSTPRAFYRDSAFYLATRGESWWWIAARDIDGSALSLYPVPPWEISVAANERDRLRPIITWGNRVMRNEDMRHITYLPSHDGLRGVGPLQICGAALSVTVESQEWAANFYAGTVPSIIGTTEVDMSPDELKLMDEQWLEKPPNMPRWLTNGLKMSESPFNPEKAQLTQQNQHQVGEAARMFSMPGILVEYQMSGQSLTYQNQADIWQDFQRRCLSPHYLEPIEQEMSDLLPRSTTSRFNLKQLLRADPKTRAEFYDKVVPLGIISPDEARQDEGYAPGSVDFAAVPPAPPQAIPDALPQIRSESSGIHCRGTWQGKLCNKLLAESITPPYRMTCPRCKTVNEDSRSPQLTFAEGLRSAIESAREPVQVRVTVPEQPAPQVHVEAQPAPIVNVSTESFVAAIADLKREFTQPRRVVRTPVRDEQGRIISVVEEVA